MISICEYRAAIGIFNLRLRTCRTKTCVCKICSNGSLGVLLTDIYYIMLFLQIFLVLSNDIESNPGPQNKSALSLLSVNINSVMVTGKLEELQQMAHEIKASVIGITETWLGDTVSSSSLLLQGYQEPERRDHNRHGGGVMMYVQDSINYTRRFDLESPDHEIIWIEFQIDSNKIFLSTVYRSSSDTQAYVVDNFYDMMHNVYTDIKQKDPFSIIYIQGDLNSPHYTWYPESTTPTGRAGNKLLEFVNYHGLSQLVTNATYVTDQTKSQLDVLITNAPGLCVNCDTLPHICHCLHLPVKAEMTLHLSHDKPYKRKIYDYDNVDWASLNHTLRRTDFRSCYDENGPNNVVSNWIELYKDTIMQYIPVRTVTIRPRNKPWLSREVRLCVRLKSRLYKQYRNNPTEHHWQKYKRARNTCVSLIRKSKNDHEKKIHDQLLDPSLSLKKFWSLTKNMLGDQRIMSIPSITLNDTSFSDNTRKAELFNQYFASHSQLPINIPDLPPFRYTTDSKFDTIIVTEPMILNILKNLNPSSATGPDELGNRVLKATASGIAFHLTILFQYCFDRCFFPDIWKCAHVTPVYKKGKRTNRENYRPISILCCISKVMEKVVHLQLHEYLFSNSIIYSRQSAYSHDDSTALQLAALVHQISENLDNGQETRTVYLDISKAFDKTWHQGLLFKLQQCGIEGSCLKWIESYLTGRSQKVVIRGQASSQLSLESGVPQGSILGPLLFLVYMNDLNNVLLSQLFMYADDAMLVEIVEDPVVSALSLNSDLHYL